MKWTNYLKFIRCELPYLCAPGLLLR